MQSTFKYNIRSNFCGWLNDTTKTYYTKWFKAHISSWGIKTEDLKSYKKGSLGYQMWNFLNKEGFAMMEKHETHDVFHVLTDYKTSKEDEVAMQCFLYGNGRRTLYMALSILIGICILPENISLFHQAYKRGKTAFPFHQLDYKPLLNLPLEKLKWMFNIPPIDLTFNI